MSLSPFLGCISNKFKKYLLPDVGSGTKDFGLRNYKLKMEDPPQGQQHRHLNNLSNELNESELGVQ